MCQVGKRPGLLAEKVTPSLSPSEAFVFQSNYINGENIPPFDERISDAITEYGIDGGGKPMKIAVENFDGRIYRVVTAVGLGAYMHATFSILGLGMKDILAGNLMGKDGYDSWFIATPEMRYAIPQEGKTADDQATELLSELDNLKMFPETERQSLVLSRLGQGEFRAQLVSYWKGCAVTGTNCIPLLKASHIKPWRNSNNDERLDVFNGLLLSPNIDTAFDTGYITFDFQGKIVLSKAITGAPAFQLHINARLRINQKLLRPEHEMYLKFHRREVFRG